MRYRSALETLIAELRANPNIDVQQAELRPGRDPEQVCAIADEVRGRYGLELPSSLLDLHVEMDGFTLVWEPKPNVLVNGRSWSIPPCFNDLRPIECLRSGNRSDEFRWTSDEGDDELEATAALQLLVDHDQEDQGTFLVAIAGTTRLYYVHNQGEDVDPLPASFDEYFARFIQLRGFFGWQTHLVEYAEARHWERAIFDRRTERYQQWMPVIFPDR